MAERSPIPVQILGKEYMIRGEAEDAPGIQRAAAVVDDTMAKIRERTGRVDSLEVAVLAALNIANHLVSLRERKEEEGARQVDPEELRGLIERIESVLQSNAAGPA